MTFITDEITYGLPITYDEFEEYFEPNQFELNVIVDYQLTSELTVRGWGITYEEIELRSIRIIE